MCCPALPALLQATSRSIIAPPLRSSPQYYANSHYAQVAGVSLRELNAMELDLLFRLDFRWGWWGRASRECGGQAV